MTGGAHKDNPLSVHGPVCTLAGRLRGLCLRSTNGTWLSGFGLHEYGAGVRTALADQAENEAAANNPNNQRVDRGAMDQTTVAARVMAEYAPL